MTLAQTASAPRPTLGFTLEGLTGREETLFKAFVRLLDHRTLQRWVYRPNGPDVRVVSETAAPNSQQTDAGTVAPLMLTISTAPGQRAHCVRLPLRADELEAELNSLGLMRIGGDFAAKSAASTAHGTAHSATVRLLRWPPAELLGTPERVRLATLMVTRPCTLAWVQQRSALAPAACAQFFAELHDGALLAEVTASPTGVATSGIASSVGDAAAPAAPGLLARIRSRLGLLVR